jgi:hypothetical protein
MFQHADIFNEHYNPTATLKQADYRLALVRGQIGLGERVELTRFGGKRAILAIGNRA